MSGPKAKMNSGVLPARSSVLRTYFTPWLQTTTQIALTSKSDVAGVLCEYQSCTVPWFWYNNPPLVYYVQDLHFITSRVYKLLILNMFLRKVCEVRKVFLTFVVAQSVFFKVFILRMTALWLKRGMYVSVVVQ